MTPVKDEGEPHDFDYLFRYCLRCGAGAQDVFETFRPCADGVTAISHIVSRRRFASLLAKAKTQ